MLEIEWELEIQHIKGIDNTSADILSRKPPLTKPLILQTEDNATR